MSRHMLQGRVSRTIAAETGVDQKVAWAAARQVLNQIADNPELLAEFALAQRAFTAVGYTNVQQPRRIRDVPLTRNDSMVFVKGLEG